VAVAGCASAGRESRAVVGTARSVPESIVKFVEVQATEAESTTATTVAVDPARVIDCVDYVQNGAFTGDVDLLAVWDAANRDVEVLRRLSRALRRSRRSSRLYGTRSSVQWGRRYSHI
jgi:hypothetical protein